MNSQQTPLLLLLLLLPLTLAAAYPTPLNCTDTTRLCTSFLAFKPSPDQTLAVIQSMFDVLPNDVTFEDRNDYVFVRKNCSCASPAKKYLTRTTYTVRESNGSMHDVAIRAYGGLAFLSGYSNRTARAGAVVSVQLMCGCSSGLWNYLMSYVMRDGDSVEGLASRFGVSMGSIESVNGISDPDNVTVGGLYYVPLNSVPGEPYPAHNDTPPAPVPAPSVNNGTVIRSALVLAVVLTNQSRREVAVGAESGLGEHGELQDVVERFCVPVSSVLRDLKRMDEREGGNLRFVDGRHSMSIGVGLAGDPRLTGDDEGGVQQVNHKGHIPYQWIIGSIGVVLALIVVVVLIFVFLRSSSAKDPDEKTSPKFQVLGTSSFCCASWRYSCYKSGDWRQANGESSDRHIDIPKAGVGTDVFEMEKPMVFKYDEILSSTDGFSDSNLLGHGTYGSVYYGLLRDQEVTIKRMTATKTKEFMAEMKVLCKVHHTNLVELIGYTATGDELFLIYEYAQKGSLKSHLHDPQNKGHSLSWIMRLQIALDAARGLEYIHEHTKPHYVHRDIKTSNILLDGAFRAKISDFGLAKLVGRAWDGEASTTKVVGTFGYLAPEYLRDGLATNKSDVYAFGVVLFEMISGKEAITRTEGSVMKTIERRSLASIMLAALRNSPDSMTMPSLKDHIDPNLMNLYPHDCVYKLAMLAKQCVEDDPILRPDMKQVVISLSQILLSSVEWEAMLAGNSQVFSGLVQGR
ncbi:hypothetical protein RJ640_008549 [Escallonia rubra]|uniref:LysM domain receptor-like kinase 3 n=1 Tax=Escallonia rubra TaxID=112253 RepID=A0AA88R6B1_9ASTE|nr:hypothetical protein RJ640_008549 [Escallonia rubra]